MSGREVHREQIVERKLFQSKPTSEESIFGEKHVTAQKETSVEIFRRSLHMSFGTGTRSQAQLAANTQAQRKKALEPPLSNTNSTLLFIIVINLPSSQTSQPPSHRTLGSYTRRSTYIIIEPFSHIRTNLTS